MGAFDRSTVGLAVLAALTLSACESSFSAMEKEWPQLKGKPIEAAVAMFGYPQSEQTILGDKVYTWSTSQGHVAITSVPSTTFGKVSATPVALTTVSSAATPITLTCEIKIATGSNNRIKTLQYDGNNAACAPFADAMRRAHKDDRQ